MLLISMSYFCLTVLINLSCTTVPYCKQGTLFTPTASQEQISYKNYIIISW